MYHSSISRNQRYNKWHTESVPGHEKFIIATANDKKRRRTVVCAHTGSSLTTLIAKSPENIIFNDNVLFYFCIPPIVFGSSYSMRRKRFF